jgi:cytidyltransferase-like protein
MKNVVVTGSFDDLRSRHVRFLEEAAKHGRLHVALWSDMTVERLNGQAPKFVQEERMYFVQALRYVDQVTIVEAQVGGDELPPIDSIRPSLWVAMEEHDTPQKRAFCAAQQIDYAVIPERELSRFPALPPKDATALSDAKKVVVTGCFDWFHSGHVRFFEETSTLGDLYVVLGHDENVYLLKGEGHPRFPEDERRYMVQSIRYVHQALVSSGHGWMDAEPEIARIKPDIYAVNEDGDRPEKRAFCEEYGLEYVVLRRLPKDGLPQRNSTTLRGF